MNRREFVASSAAAALGPPFATAAHSASCADQDFNRYIKMAVQGILKDRTGGGYGGPKEKDTSYAFTRNLAYGAPDAVPQYPAMAKRAEHFEHATMCVAGVTEILIEAINCFMSDKDRCPKELDLYKTVPVDMWKSGTIDKLRGYLFMQADVHNIWRRPVGQVPVIPVKRADGTVKKYDAVSRGSAHAFHIFNMGEELPFSALKRGDFLNLNRVKGPGHATVFWSYIRQSGGRFVHAPTWSADVVGFEYFAAQGPKWPKQGGGFAFRDAYFDKAPRGDAGNIQDPGRIIRSSSQLLLNTGRLWSPERWNPGKARDDINALVRSRMAGSGATRDAAALEIMNEELGPTVYLTTGEE